MGQLGAWADIVLYCSPNQVTLDTLSVAQLDTGFSAHWTYDSTGRVLTAQTPATGTVYPTYFSYDLDRTTRSSGRSPRSRGATTWCSSRTTP